MVLTEKESGLLKDMKTQEELCIKKYTKYAQEAKCPELKSLFESIAQTETEHLRTVCDMMDGKEPQAPTGALKANNANCVACPAVYSNAENKTNDSFLCKDMLATEKHASSVYNMSVFEFRYPSARRMLAHIQAEEQQHGEQLFAFMTANGMYNA